MRLPLLLFPADPPPASSPGWAHELRHDGYRCKSMSAMAGCGYTINGADLVETLPADVASAAEAPPFDAEVVWLDAWHALHGRVNDAALECPTL